MFRKIVEGCDEKASSSFARERGLPSLRQDGAHKLLTGDISFQDLITVASE